MDVSSSTLLQWRMLVRYFPTYRLQLIINLKIYHKKVIGPHVLGFCFGLMI